MKKILSSVLSIVLSIFFVITPIGAKVLDINEQFIELQNKVTSVLNVSNNRYVYSEQEVVNVIKNENFDFDELNKKYGTSYSEESFIKLALHNIENAKLGIQYFNEDTVCTYGTYCGRNAVEEGWNYFRFYYNKTETTTKVYQLRNLANNWTLVAAAGQFANYVPGLGTAIAVGIAAGVGWNAWYATSLSNAMEYNNTFSGCGTVTDINKFTTVYSCYNQSNFNA